MARLRPIKSVRVLTVEEKTRVANLFTLLIEVNLQTGVTNKRRSPKKTNAKKAECDTFENCEVGCCCQHKHRPIKNIPCQIHYVNTELSRTCRPSSPLRDLFLHAFARILKCNIINFIMEYCNDRHNHFSTTSRIIYNH